MHGPAVVIDLATSPRTVFRDPMRLGGDGPAMVVVPAGAFVMGSPASEAGREPFEGPQRTVRVAAFAIGQSEVTFGEWDACVAMGGCSHRPDDRGWGRGDRPVVDVGWDDARQYAAWLSRQTGQQYRLPSEAEWEYAARAGTTMAYGWGERIGRNLANCDGCGSPWDGRQTAPVRSFPANRWGLYEMHGNVWEWVQDCYNASYDGAPTTGAPWTSGDCAYRVQRGGSWRDGPGWLRSASRGLWVGPDPRSAFTGLRIARDL